MVKDTSFSKSLHLKAFENIWDVLRRLHTGLILPLSIQDPGEKLIATLNGNK